MAKQVGESLVFRILLKGWYLTYLIVYLAYAAINYKNGSGDALVNVLVLAFVSFSAVIFLITTVTDFAYKNADARSAIKVHLHTLKNLFKIIKVGVTLLVLVQTIAEQAWNTLTVIMLVLSLPAGLIMLVCEYIYVGIARTVRLLTRQEGEDDDDDWDDDDDSADAKSGSGGVKKRSAIREAMDRIRLYAESDVAPARMSWRDYDVDEESDKVADFDDKYPGYEEDDDYEYPGEDSCRTGHATQLKAEPSKDTGKEGLNKTGCRFVILRTGKKISITRNKMRGGTAAVRRSGRNTDKKSGSCGQRRCYKENTFFRQESNAAHCGRRHHDTHSGKRGMQAERIGNRPFPRGKAGSNN